MKKKVIKDINFVCKDCNEPLFFSQNGRHCEQEFKMEEIGIITKCRVKFKAICNNCGKEIEDYFGN